jgi:hypothetical protein
LPSHPHRPQFRDDDRERIMRARQAAEALFGSKPPVAQSGDQQSVRPPRVLRIIAPAAPVRHREVAAPIGRKKPAKAKIPVSQFTRIRAWTKYGMTVSEVAEVYGVAIGEIHRILRRA